MRLHPVIEQHRLHLLAVGSAVLLKIPREQFTPLRRVIAFYNECTIDGTVLRTKIGPNGITVSRRDVIQIADTRDWQVGRAKPFLSQDELSLSYAIARANETLYRCRRVFHREQQYLRVVEMVRGLSVDCVGRVDNVELRDVRRVQRNFKHSLRFRAKQVGDNTFQIRRTR